MAAGRFIVGPYFPARNRDDVLQAGALLYVYENGTTTKATIYTDEGLSILSSNPVVANASGQFPAVWGEAGTADVPVPYTVMVTTSDGASIGNPSTFDDFYPSLNWENANITLAEAAAVAADASADSAATSASAAADSAVAADASADIAAAALFDIEEIAADAPEAPSIANKANLNGDNIVGANVTAFREAIGALGSAELIAFESKAAVQAATIPVAINRLNVRGWQYVRVGSEPTYGGLQSADGAWFEYDDEELDAEAFDVFANGSDMSSAWSTAMAAAIAKNRSLKLPSGEITIASPPTLPDQACTLRMVGSGKYKSYTGGTNGDPTGVHGTTLKYTGASGTLFPWALTAGNRRVYLTLEAITFEGNPSASSGHCIHLAAAGTTFAFIVDYKEVVVRNAKQHGIFHDGNVFECNLYDVRANSCGGSGLKLAANTGGLPGETRLFGGYYSYNDIGLDLGGGGHNSLHGVSSSYNTTHDIKNDGADFEAFEIQCESASTSALNADKILLANCTSPMINGALLNIRAGATGSGIKCESVLSPYINKLRTNSAVADAAFKDIRFDNSTTRGTVLNYWPNDFVFRYDFGTGGGTVFSNGGARYSGNGAPRESFTVTSYALVSPNAKTADTFTITFNGPGTGCEINNPAINSAYQDGQVIRFTFINNSGGALSSGINLYSLFRGTVTAPANGFVRTASFEWNEALAKWVKQYESGDL